MSYSDLFSGEEIWLGPECEPGWIPPFLKTLHTVLYGSQQEVSKNDPPITNMVIDRDRGLEAVWGIEEGWSAMAVMLKNLGEILSLSEPSSGGENFMDAEQLVVRNDDWSVKSTHYRVQWKGAEVEGI